MSSDSRFRPNSSESPLLNRKPLRGEIIFHAPAQLAYRERLYLYSAVFALAPERCLEVGVAEGGGSKLIHAALCDLEHGRLVSLDPSPQVAFDWSEISDRATLMSGFSPEDLGRAMQLAGGPFDFVFLDANHEREFVREDLRGLVDVTGPGCPILCHDAYHEGVILGIDDALSRGLPLRDCGLVGRARSDGIENGKPSSYGGLRRLVRI